LKELSTLLIFLHSIPENQVIALANSVGDSFIPVVIMSYERIAGAKSVGDDRIFRNGMEENESNQYL
jgi:hypothetical protein